MTASPDPITPRTRYFQQFERALSAVFIVLLSLSIAATIGVLFSRMPPLFNQKAIYYELGNIICLLVLLVLLGVLVAATVVVRLAALRRAVLLFLIVVVTLEGLLCVFDRYIISAVGSPLQSAFRNVRVHGDLIWLGQPTAGSPFGFRNRELPGSGPPAYRILFLGSSFVSGSGSSFDTNYPQATENSLRTALPEHNVGVMSAGVDSYGVKEERLIYEHLLEQGYKFDLVVINFHMGSDFSNDIPGTFRESVAGEAQRFPDNWFLRAFYPVDTYLFRYAYYFEITFNPRFGAVDSAGPTDATCKASANFINYASGRTWLYYGAGADKRLYLDSNIRELFQLAATISAHGAKATVVLLPDRFAVLTSDHAGHDMGGVDLTWTRRYMEQQVGSRLSMFDLAPYFENRPDLFLCNDLHWNDPGNVEGGRRVSEYLARYIQGNLTGVSATTPASN